MIDPDANAAVEEWRRLAGARPPAASSAPAAPAPAGGLAALLAAVLALFRRRSAT